MGNLFYKAQVLLSAVKLATLTSSLFLPCAWTMCRNDPEMSIAGEEFVCHRPQTEKKNTFKRCWGFLCCFGLIFFKKIHISVVCAGNTVPVIQWYCNVWGFLGNGIVMILLSKYVIISHISHKSLPQQCWTEKYKRLFLWNKDKQGQPE